MKKYARLVLPILALLVLLVPVSKAHAQATRPASYGCNFCESYVEWTAGTTGGGQTTFYVPSINLTGTDGLIRMFVMTPSNGQQGDYLFMGFEANVDYNGFCGQKFSTGNIFIAEVSHGGIVNWAKCSGGNLLYRGDFQFFANPSGTSEVVGADCQSGTCEVSGTISGVAPNLASSYLINDERVQTTVNGTFQGPTFWTYNEYYHNGWVYQSNGGTITGPPPAGGPIQMYWNPTPNGAANHGGSLEMCEEDNGSTTC